MVTCSWRLALLRAWRVRGSTVAAGHFREPIKHGCVSREQVHESDPLSTSKRFFRVMPNVARAMAWWLSLFHCLLTPCSGLKSGECLIDVDVSKIRMKYSSVEDHHDSPELLQYRADLPDDRQMYKLKMKLGRKAYRELLKGQRWGDSILGLFMLGYVFRMIWFVGLWRYCE